jgi:hypothetical protein
MGNSVLVGGGTAGGGRGRHHWTRNEIADCGAYALVIAESPRVDDDGDNAADDCNLVPGSIITPPPGVSVKEIGFVLEALGGVTTTTNCAPTTLRTGRLAPDCSVVRWRR